MRHTRIVGNSLACFFIAMSCVFFFIEHREGLCQVSAENSYSLSRLVNGDQTTKFFKSNKIASQSIKKFLLSLVKPSANKEFQELASRLNESELLLKNKLEVLPYELSQRDLSSAYIIKGGTREFDRSVLLIILGSYLPIKGGLIQFHVLIVNRKGEISDELVLQTSLDVHEQSKNGIQFDVTKGMKNLGCLFRFKDKSVFKLDEYHIIIFKNKSYTFPWSENSYGGKSAMPNFKDKGLLGFTLVKGMLDVKFPVLGNWETHVKESTKNDESKDGSVFESPKNKTP